MRAVRSQTLLRPGSAAAAGPARLQLTSLVDMMVILVVFLLKSFSVEGQLVAPAAGLELPRSSVRTPAEAGLVVAVSPERITVAGRDILALNALLDEDEAGRDILRGALAAAQEGAAAAPVLIQADHRTDYRHLREVLSACAAAGWSDVSLVVLEGTS